jgi:hypothetical protein
MRLGTSFVITFSNSKDFEISNFQTGTMLFVSVVIHVSFVFNSSKFGIVNLSIMKSDCGDPASVSDTSPGMSTQDDIVKLLTAISSQMMQNYQDIQERLDNTELRLSQEINCLSQDHEDFKLETRSACQLIAGVNPVPSNNVLVGNNISSGNIPVPTVPTASQVSPSTSSVSQDSSGSAIGSMPASSPVDFQLQMMTMLTDTFSKLTPVLSDKGADMKADWPKFSGDSKKFCSWYLAILAQLSIPPWLDLYDTSINDVVSTTTNTTLNGKLYAKLLVSLDSQVLQNMMSRKHIRGNGLLLLKELVQTYRPRNVPEVIAAKTGEFWSHTKHLPNETVDSYYIHFHDLLDDLADADELISTKAVIHHFLFTLGSEFESIQNNFRIGLLPPEWQTQDWPTMLALCWDYSNSVNPQGLLKKDSSSDSGMSQAERAAWHKKVKQWFFNPAKYKSEMTVAQKLHVGKCLYHLTKSHATQDCFIKKDCEKLLAEKKDGVTTQSATGHLRHITEQDLEDDVEIEEPSDSLPTSHATVGLRRYSAGHTYK